MRFFITHIVPRDKEIEMPVSIATCNFSRILISGGMFDRTYSLPAVNIRQRFKNEKEIEYVCSRTRTWGNLFYKISPLLEQLHLFFLITRKSSLWLYNISVQSEFLFLLLKWFKPSVKIYTIVLDYTPGDKYSERHLKRILASDGIITLAENNLFLLDNKKCLPGVVSMDKVLWPKVKKPLKKKFLLSGALNEQISQISKMLNIFSRHPDIELHISGILDDESILDPYNNHQNIIYHGKVSWSEYLDLMHSCPFILSTRDINAPENQCNFPSKIIESLLHNRIVISTIYYPQLKNLKLLFIHNEQNAMEKDIIEILNSSDEYLLGFANQAELTKNLFNVNVWKKTIESIEKNK